MVALSILVLQPEKNQYVVWIAPDKLGLVDIEGITDVDVRRDAFPEVVTDLGVQNEAFLNVDTAG